MQLATTGCMHGRIRNLVKGPARLDKGSAPWNPRTDRLASARTADLLRWDIALNPFDGRSAANPFCRASPPEHPASVLVLRSYAVQRYRSTDAAAGGVTGGCTRQGTNREGRDGGQCLRITKRDPPVFVATAGRGKPWRILTSRMRSYNRCCSSLLHLCELAGYVALCASCGGLSQLSEMRSCCGGRSSRSLRVGLG
jgi:hypothetical protein